MSLHSHKNIRDQTAAELLSKIEARQSQRLLIAMEAKQAREIKIGKLTVKDQAKYIKLGDKLVTKLAKIDAALQVCEMDLHSMQVISNQLTQYDMELDQ